MRSVHSIFSPEILSSNPEIGSFSWQDFHHNLALGVYYFLAKDWQPANRNSTVKAYCERPRKYSGDLLHKKETGNEMNKRIYVKSNVFKLKINRMVGSSL